MDFFLFLFFCFFPNSLLSLSKGDLDVQGVVVHDCSLSVAASGGRGGGGDRKGKRVEMSRPERSPESSLQRHQFAGERSLRFYSSARTSEREDLIRILLECEVVSEFDPSEQVFST